MQICVDNNCDIPLMTPFSMLHSSSRTFVTTTVVLSLVMFSTVGGEGNSNTAKLLYKDH